MAVARLPLPTEEQEQATYFQWLEYVQINGQRLRPHCYHVANGGSRHPAEAGKLKGQGVTPGVPDICIDVPAGEFHGLRIEMKRRGEKPNADQRDQLDLRRSMGYRALVAEGFDEARRITVQYLRLQWVVIDRWAN